MSNLAVGGAFPNIKIAGQAGAFQIPPFDYQAFTYYGATDNIKTQTFYQGGSSGKIVATLTYTYVSAGVANDDNILTVTKS